VQHQEFISGVWRSKIKGWSKGSPQQLGGSMGEVPEDLVSRSEAEAKTLSLRACLLKASHAILEPTIINAKYHYR